MKKIMFVSPTAILGGAERVMFNLALEYLERGDEVFFYIMSRGLQPGWERLAYFDNFHMIIKDYKSEKTSLFDFIKSVYEISKKDSLDIVFSSHTHINSALSLLRSLRILKCRRLVSRESTVIFDRFTGWKSLLFRVMYRFSYGKQDLLIFQTDYMKKSLLKALGFNPVKKGVLKVLNNPVNCKHINERLGLPDLSVKIMEAGYIVACGRFVSLKQFDKLVLAFSNSLVASTGLYLVLIGDGPCLENVKKLSIELGVSDRVIFTGKLENPIPFFQHAHLGVLSSEVEGFPNVLIEMMASGIKNIITTPSTKAVNFIENITVTEDTKLEGIVKEFLRFDEFKKDFSSSYIETIKNNYSSERFINRVEEILN